MLPPAVLLIKAEATSFEATVPTTLGDSPNTWIAADNFEKFSVSELLLLMFPPVVLLIKSEAIAQYLLK